MTQVKRLSLHVIRQWMLSVLLCACTSSCLLAGSGNTVKIPQGTKRVKNGILATLDCRWMDGTGRRPLRIKFAMRKTDRDRTITVQVFPDSYQPRWQPMRFTTKIEIPEGEKEVTKTIYIPQTSMRSLRCEFYEDGRKLEDLSMDEGLRTGGYYSQEQPSVLIVDSDAPLLSERRDDIIKRLRTQDGKTNRPSQELPNIGTIQFLSSNYQHDETTNELKKVEGYRDVDSLTILGTAPNIELVPPDDVPNDGIGLGSTDIIAIPFADLSTLAKDAPQKKEAIDFFVRNGGNLIVYGEALSTTDISHYFQSDHFWNQVDIRSHTRKISRQQFFEDAAFGGSREERNQQLQNKLKEMPKIQTASHGLGRLLCCSDADPFLREPFFWRFMLEELAPRTCWLERHGISPQGSNGDFWDFLIPDYGATPVISFLSVITIFVFVIGPVNFYVLKRMRRFYLLPFAIVIAALITTAIMMTYAFLGDGVNRRMRLRSFTALEQRTDGQIVAALHCRHSYLATVAPLKGFVFPDRTAVFPIDVQPSHYKRHSQRKNKKQQIEYDRGYIGSRSTAQLLTTDVVETKVWLDLVSNETGDCESATNRLGVDIDHAWIVDENKTVWYAKNCRDGGQLELTKSNANAETKVFRKILSANRPKPPEGLDKANAYGVEWVQLGTSSVDFSSGLLSTEMKDSATSILRAHPRTFVVISSNKPSFIETGMEATEVASFHMIRGRWSP